MIKATAGFVVYGVHKDGLLDPDGRPFIDEAVIEGSKEALKEEGVRLAEEGLVVSTKQEAKGVILKMAKDDAIDCLVLFTGTWAWAAHIIAAVREFAKTGKGIVIWTHPGSQGWRPVGGLVLSAALNEVGIGHRFIYGGVDEVGRVASYCKASALKKSLEMTTLMAFGGRGMGQTCGVADPSQWMRVFGIDIDSRDTYELLEAAKNVPDDEIGQAYDMVEQRLSVQVERSPENERSIRLYLALKGMKESGAFDYYTIQSFPGMGDYYTATCFAQSMMLDDGVPTSTLSDFNTAMTSIIITSLSSERIYYGDLQHIDKQKKEIKIIGDGAVPPSLADASGVSLAGHGIPTEGSAGGMSINLVCKPGKGVLARLSRVNGEFRVVMVRCSISVPGEDEIEGRRHECGIPHWPHAFVTVEGDIDKMIENWNNEYACLGYGEDLYRQVIDFCELAGIETVLP
ncbi:MAG: hypothetical protein FWG03_03470 [Clostridiales bacterium]|nr:hypothetical protein [Clostridiales bacterium]